MHLTISSFDFKSFTPKNKIKNISFLKNKNNNSAFKQTNLPTKIVIGQLPSSVVEKKKESKNPIYTYPCVAWEFSGKPKQKLVNEAIGKYDLKISPKTLEYVFNSKSLEEDRFQKYETLGLHVYNLYLKSLLFRHFPYKSENDLTKIQSAASKNQEAAILATLFDGGLFNNVGLTAKKPHARYFHALLGAIVFEGGKYAHKDVNSFLKNHAQSTIIKTMPTMPKNKLEVFYDDFRQAGYNPKELYIETIDDEDEFITNVYYQKRMILEPIITYDSEDGQSVARRKVLKLIQEGDIFANALDDEPSAKDKRKARGERLALLQELCDDWGVKFNNINLLNRAFLYKRVDNFVVNNQDNYQVLEYIGDAVLNYCVNRMLFERYPDSKKSEISKRFIDFSKNETLSRLSKKMNLREYLSSQVNNNSSKFDADLFEAFIGAYYLDDMQSGLDDVYEFLYDNFSNIICPVEYDD
ncbi:MAG: hypothetical protein IKL52_01590 [Candidatus Gastranaerophilales bacterium]|nr:hypothetical protein [Candidatus Gastranaerophilales bacterium]